MMDKVYIVTDGVYDTYDIVAVYGDEKMAKHHAENLRDGEYTEHDVRLTPFPVPMGMKAFYLHYSLLRDQWHISLAGDSLSLLGNSDIFEMAYTIQKEGPREFQFRTHLIARDEQHAIEMAKERYVFMVETYGYGVQCSHDFGCAIKD